MNRKYWLTFVLILSLSLVLRLPHLFDKELGIDEDITIRDAKLIKESASLKYLYTPLPVEINPPLFFNILGFSLFLNDSVMTLRIIIFAIGMLSIIIFFLLVKSLFNEKFALLSTFLYGISPMHVIYSQHVRVYIFLFLLFTLAMYFLYKFLFLKESKSLVFLGIIYLVSIYSHYYTMLFMLGNGIIVILFYSLNRKTALSKYLLMGVVVLLLSIPALLLLRLQYVWYTAVGGTGGIGGVAPLLTLYVAPYPLYKFSLMVDVSTVMKNFPYIFLLFPILLGLFAYGAFKLYQHNKEKFVFVFVNLAAPYLFYVAVGFFWPVFSFRYFTFFLPMYVILLSYGLFKINNKYLKWLLLILLVFGWLFVIFYYYSITPYYLWGEHIAV